MLCFALLCLAMLCIALLCLLALHALLAMSEQHSHHLANCILTIVMSEQHSFRILKQKCTTASLQVSLPPTPCQLHHYTRPCHLHLINCILTNAMTEQHFECFALLCCALLCFALLCYALLCFALLGLVLLCFALLCLLALLALLALLCFALLCCACFALLCFAISLSLTLSLHLSLLVPFAFLYGNPNCQALLVQEMCYCTPVLFQNIESKNVLHAPKHQNRTHHHHQACLSMISKPKHQSSVNRKPLCQRGPALFC